MNVRQISINDLRALSMKESGEVEKGDPMIEPVTHGKVVTFMPSYDPAAPAFDPEDWDS